MKTRNFNFYDPQEEDWNIFINHFHDPDLLYYYIKQIYSIEDVEKLLTEVPDGKTNSVGSIFKLEVFRASMQYVEEFIMYFLAYIGGYENIGEKLVKTGTTKEVKFFLKCLKEGKHDEFSQKKKSSNFKDLLMEIFGYNLFLNSKEYKDSNDKFDKIILESIEIINNDLLKIANFYLEHLKIYNAIKHGTRVFPLIQELKSPDEFANGNKIDAVIAICKDSSESARPYSLSLPLDYLIDPSFKITERTHTLFECIRNIARDKLMKNAESKFKIYFFKSVQQEGSEKRYIRALSGKNVFVIERPNDFENFNTNLDAINACRIVLKGNNVFFYTKCKKESSLKYPFLVKTTSSNSFDLEPHIIMNLNFNFDLYDLSVGQYFDLLKIIGLQKQKRIKKIFIAAESTNKKIGTANGKDIVFPELPNEFDMEYLRFLLKLEKAIGELIPFPVFTSKKQEQIIGENIGKSLSKKEAEDILNTLKSDEFKITCSVISIKIMDLHGKEVSKRTFDPIPFPSDLHFQSSDEQKKFEEEIFEIPGKSISTLNRIDEIPDNIIKEIDLLVKGETENLPEIKDVDLPLYELITTINYVEPKFWYKEHLVTMVFRPVIYFNPSSPLRLFKLDTYLEKQIFQ
jgi:hypothetical protein